MNFALKKQAVDLFENNGKPFDGFDTKIVKFTRKQENSALRPVMVWISNMGEPWTLYPVAGVLAAQWVSRQRGIDAATLGAALGGSAVLNKVIKGVVQRPRPKFRIHLSKSSGSSFPSSHMTMSVATYGSMAYLMARRSGRLLDDQAIRKFWGPALLLCGLIGYSRIYQGLHHPSDVLGSIGVSIMWLALCGLIRSLVEMGEERGVNASQRSEGTEET